jgi:hypothetical protein
MSNQVVTPPYNIWGAYESLIEAFRGAVEDAGLTVSRLGVPVPSCFTQSADATGAEFKECIYLKDWPSRRLGKGKRLDIVIKALETLERPGWSLTKSTVYVNYFVVIGSEAELVQSLHYDFVQNGQVDHPLFHVQLSDELISEEDLRSVGFDLVIKAATQPNHCWVTTRIPTPDMTLASVLYCLVADHFGLGIFTQFASKVAKVQTRLPSPNFEALKNSLQNSMEHFKSSHWFAHMVGSIVSPGN